MSAARLLILPAIVLVIGAASALPAVPGSMLRPVDVVIIVLDVALSLRAGRHV